MKKTVLLAGVCFLGVRLACAQPYAELQKELPFKAPKGELEGLTITIDPGEGGNGQSGSKTPGLCGVQSKVAEGDLNMLVAGELQHYLGRAGAKVCLTRIDDRAVGCEERSRMAQRVESHLLVSLHHGVGKDPAEDRVRVALRTSPLSKASQALEKDMARCVGEEVQKSVHYAQPYELKEKSDALLDQCPIPALEVELGCLSSPAFDQWVSRRGTHSAEARGIYNGIVRAWKERRQELEACRASRLGAKSAETPWIQNGIPSDDGPSTPTQAGTPSPEQVKFAARFWPSSKPPQNAQEAQWILNSYKRQILSDWTFFHLEVSAEDSSAGIVLRGRTNYPCIKKAAEELLWAAGCKLASNGLEQLPSARLGEKRFGVVRVPMAFTWGTPGEGEDVQTQLLLGERVYLLDEDTKAGYLLLHASDGYVGWVKASDVLRMNEAEFSAWESAELATVRQEVPTGVVRLAAGMALPVVGRDASSAILRVPCLPGSDEETSCVRVAASQLSLRAKGTSTPGELAIGCALNYLTTPYMFGGRSRLGIDCSGLTGISYATVGLSLPRDARQQVLVGKLVAMPWHMSALKAGDLLFFCDEKGKVIHTGLSLGGARFIHASPPHVQINSFDPADPLFDKELLESFSFARRPLP